MMRKLLKWIKRNRANVKDQQASALIAKEGAVRGHVDLYDGNNIVGWAARNGSVEPVTVDIYVNDRHYSSIEAKEYRKDLEDARIGNGCSGFISSMRIQDLLNEFGSEPEIRVCSHGYELIGSKLKVAKENIRYSVDVYKEGICAGWIVDLNNPHTQLDLDIYIDDEKVGVFRAGVLREDLSILDIPNLYHGFHIDFSNYTDKEIYKARVELKYSSIIELAPEKVFCAFYSKVKSLTDLQQYLRAQGYHKKSPINNHLVHGILPALIDKIRSDGELDYEIVKYCSIRNDERIAVIIPVYKGIEETCNCIKSVVRSQNEAKFRLIVINDCSPQVEMLPALERLQKEHGFELYSNDENLGFVGTVNRGMKLADGCDVVLLNSDTIVPDRWLDAIRTEAYDQPDSSLVGTVTPLSNNATICSFPRFCVDNEIPNGFTVDDIAHHCEENRTPAVDMPTAHGYCMFIKRDVLCEVGYFDEQKWGKGYAEENDFSMRASKLGWRHVVTNKTFVHHLGSVSFAEDSTQFISNNLDKLNSIYPDYPKLVESFVKKDPVTALRNELAIRMMVSESKKLTLAPPAKGRSILFISHSIGGGTKVATDDLANLLNREGQSVYMLTSPVPNVWRVESCQSNLFVDFYLSEQFESLVEFLRKLDIWHIHYHHTLQFDEKVWSLPGILCTEYDVTLHDFYFVCPRVNFTYKTGEYCGEPEIKYCNKCLAENGVHESSHLGLDDVGTDIEGWREFFAGKLSLARRVFVPSKDTKDRLSKKIDLDNVYVRYHAESNVVVNVERNAKPIGSNIKIGFLGAIGPHKGFGVVESLAKYIDDNGLNFNISIIGYTCNDEKLSEFDCVKITGPYKKNLLKNILEKENVDLIFLSSIWPETYSYTYSEVSRLGYPVLSFDIGAVPERMCEQIDTGVIPTDFDAPKILDAVSDFLSREVIGVRLLQGEYDSILDSYYGFQVS